MNDMNDIYDRLRETGLRACVEYADYREGIPAPAEGHVTHHADCGCLRERADAAIDVLLTFLDITLDAIYALEGTTQDTDEEKE